MFSWAAVVEGQTRAQRGVDMGGPVMKGFKFCDYLSGPRRLLCSVSRPHNTLHRTPTKSMFCLFYTFTTKTVI